jgi:hypothetical protein
MRGIDGFPRLARSYIFKIRRFPKIPKQTLFDAGTVSGTSAALESLETSFREDLNGDGTIGPVTTVIESFGSTSLVQVGSNYFLDSISTGTGPELKYNGAPIAAAQFGASVVLIGAEATPTGYDVAWTVTLALVLGSRLSPKRQGHHDDIQFADFTRSRGARGRLSSHRLSFARRLAHRFLWRLDVLCHLGFHHVLHHSRSQWRRRARGKLSDPACDPHRAALLAFYPG